MKVEKIRDVIDALYVAQGSDSEDKLGELLIMAASCLIDLNSDNCEVKAAGHKITLVIEKDI